MKRRIFMGLCAAAVAAGLSGPAQAATELRIGFIPVADFMGIFVAIDQGIFEANDLDVTLTQMSNQQVIISSLVSGSADMGTTTPINVIQAAEAGLPIVGVTATQVTPIPTLTTVAARPDAGISEPADLVGKRVAVNALGAIHHVVTVRWLRENNVDPRSVSLVETPFPQMPDVLQSGQIDAAMTTDPFAGRILDGGAVNIGQPFDSVPAGNITSLYAISQSYADAHPEAVVAFQNAMREATRFIQENEAEARESLAKWTNQPAEVVAGTAIPNFAPDLSREQLDFWRDEMAAQGMASGDTDMAPLLFAAP